MSLSPDDVRKVARLSRLAIPEDQIESYRAQLQAVLGYVERLREVNVEGVEPLTHVADSVNRLDDDVPGPTLSNETLMQMAPETIPPFVKVPKVIGDGGGGVSAFKLREFPPIVLFVGGLIWLPMGIARNLRSGHSMAYSLGIPGGIIALCWLCALVFSGCEIGAPGVALMVGDPHSVIVLRDAVRSRRMSAAEAARATLDRVASFNPTLNAFLDIRADAAIQRARDIDADISRGNSLPLAGVPIAIKDNMCLGPDVPGGGGRTTAGSRILENYESPYTATAVKKLIAAGAIIVAKTNLDEFAMGSSGENSAFGPTKNPHDLSRVPGGSSSGSAAAVAAGIVPAALGSDTGGSIRQPAGFCGIVGIKPTYGRVSRYGLIAYASSLDQIGPLARTIPDAAAVLNIICGHDPLDSTSSDHAVPEGGFSADLDKPIEALILGIPKQAFSPANHPAVLAAMERAIRIYTAAGARIVEVDLPHIEHGIAAYYVVALAEASSNLARFDGIRYGRRAKLAPGEDLFDLYCKTRAEGFGPEVRRRIMLGTYVLSAGYYDAYYNTALKVRRKIKMDYDAAFSPEGGVGCHALLMPSSPGPAFKLGEKTTDPLAMYLEDFYTVGVNLAGLPAITVPGGYAEVDSNKLPVGLQLIGAPWDEARLLRIARMLEVAGPANGP